MDRSKFLKLIGLGIMSTSLNTFARELKDLKETDQVMPVLFIGHGSPMNAIEQSTFTSDLTEMGSSLPRPKAILCVSAHWLTRGTKVEVSPSPKMIYDMGGFPDELYQVRYPAPGSPDFAKETAELINSKGDFHIDEETWGFDHGNWSIMKWLFPEAEIPVYQLSIDYHKPASYHYDLASQLYELRKRGVLIVGSGNATHNLGMFKPDFSAKPEDWTLEFDEIVKTSVNNYDHNNLLSIDKYGSLAQIAHPEPSHWFPLIYSLGATRKDEEVNHFHESIQHGTFSMRSIRIG